MKLKCRWRAELPTLARTDTSWHNLGRQLICLDVVSWHSLIGLVIHDKYPGEYMDVKVTQPSILPAHPYSHEPGFMTACAKTKQVDSGKLNVPK